MYSTATTLPQQEPAQSSRFAIRQLVAAFAFLREEVHGELPMQMASVLLHVALDEGVSMQQLVERTGLTQSSISRNVSALGKIHRKGRPGHDLVETYLDPSEPRRKLVRLSKKGKHLVGRLLAKFESEF